MSRRAKRIAPGGQSPPDAAARTRPAPADQALLARAASGELEAFGAIYERYQHAVFRFACAMTGSRDAAADITHDAFLAVLADASRFDPNRASLSTYLYGVVRNLCRERLRRASRLQPMDAGVFDRPADRGAPIDAVADAELAGLVRRALAELPSRYRELLLLCDVHDLSYADAAAIVGTSVPAVRSRLHRGRQQLRALLSARMVSPLSLLRPERCAI